MGTDTPGGSRDHPAGDAARGCFFVRSAEVTPHIVLAMATGHVGRAHGLPIGILKKGKATNIVLLDRIKGSVVKDALYFFNKGHLSGISVVMTDGEVKVAGRSQQTPPAERVAIIEGEG